MKKIITTALLLSTSLFASDSFLYKRPLFACMQDMDFANIQMYKKGEMIKINEIGDLNVNDFIFKSTHRFGALSFLKDGFFYDGKLFKFENEFSDVFFKYLKNAKLVNVVCKTPNIEVFGSKTTFQEQKNYETINLDSKFQILIGKYLLRVAQHHLLEDADGGILLGTSSQFFIENLLDEENIKKSTENLESEIAKLEIKIDNQILKDKKAKELAIANNRGYGIYADAYRFQEFQNLKGTAYDENK